MDRRAIGLLVALTIAVFAAAIGLVVADRSDDHQDVVDAGSDAGVASDADLPEDAAVDVDVEPDGWPEPEPGERVLQAIHEGMPVGARFLVGAPGVYPPLQAEGEQVTLPEPARAIGGAVVEHHEVYTRATEKDLAFWGEIEPGTDVVELVDAADVRVETVGTPGVPVGPSTVHLARSPLALVVRTAQTFEGAATFDAVPPGTYWLTVDTPGWLQDVRAIEVGEGDETFAVHLERGRSISGTVTGPDGAPVPDALVSIFVAADGEPFGGVPEEVAQTDAQGRYSADGVPPGHTAAVAVSPAFAPGRSPTVDTSSGERNDWPLDVSLTPAVRVTVNVVDPPSSPVPGAHVRWLHEESGAGGSAIADDRGQVVFSGVAPGAVVRASVGRYESPTMEVPDRPTVLRLPLRLPGELGPWRMRIALPTGIDLRALSVVDDESARCVASPLGDPRDFTLRGCGTGDATIALSTTAGFVETTRPFRDGMTVEVAEPHPVEVRVEGARNEPWADTGFALIGADGTVVEPEVGIGSGSERIVRTQLFDGAWRLRVTNPRVGTRSFDVPVNGAATEMEVELVANRRHRFIVTDRFGAAVTGAYAMLFDGERLVEVSRTAGQLPTNFRVHPDFEGRLLVVDARRGEGSAAVGGEPVREPVRVELDQTVLSLSIPTSRRDREELEQILGARLVSDDAGWLIDFDRADAPAARAGIERADRIVSAWAEAGGTRVIVHRKGTGYVDVRVAR